MPCIARDRKNGHIWSVNNAAIYFHKFSSLHFCQSILLIYRQWKNRKYTRLSLTRPKKVLRPSKTNAFWDPQQPKHEESTLKESSVFQLNETWGLHESHQEPKPTIKVLRTEISSLTKVKNGTLKNQWCKKTCGRGKTEQKMACVVMGFAIYICHKDYFETPRHIDPKIWSRPNHTRSVISFHSKNCRVHNVL